MQTEAIIIQGTDFSANLSSTATHAKVIIHKDGSIEVTLGKLNRDGHYHPNRNLYKTVTAPGMSHVLHDGAGWNWRQVEQFVKAAEIANWEAVK
jgi:hypothetical protein